MIIARYVLILSVCMREIEMDRKEKDRAKIERRMYEFFLQNSIIDIFYNSQV